MAGEKRGRSSLPLLIIFVFAITRKKYKLPDVEFFIPIIGGEERKPSEIARKVIESIEVKLTTKPSFGWLISAKPVYGVKIPLSIWLPFFGFFVIPQIKAQIGKNIIIRPEERYFGLVKGYRVVIKNFTFWA